MRSTTRSPSPAMAAAAAEARYRPATSPVPSSSANSAWPISRTSFSVSGSTRRLGTAEASTACCSNPRRASSASASSWTVAEASPAGDATTSTWNIPGAPPGPIATSKTRSERAGGSGAGAVVWGTAGGTGTTMPRAAILAAIMAANCCGVRIRKSIATMSDSSPGKGVSSNRAGSTYSRRSRTALFSAARRSSRVQSRAAYSADTNTTTTTTCSP
jgi:hypothetical protein